jgi:hypothetical protein
MGLPLKSLHGFGVPAESYGFANKQSAPVNPAAVDRRPRCCVPVHLRDPSA